jgi:chemotaxis protein CheD
MHPGEAELPTVYLKPGEMYFAETPAQVITVLGSCVTIILHHRRLRLGAICHALLPAGACDEDGLRYLNCAMHEMLDLFLIRGIPGREIEAKLFGGGDVLMSSGSGGKTVGQQNIEAALELVENESLKLISCDLGGVSGRKISFRTDTGQVLLKRLKPANSHDPGSTTKD